VKDLKEPVCGIERLLRAKDLQIYESVLSNFNFLMATKI